MSLPKNLSIEERLAEALKRTERNLENSKEVLDKYKALDALFADEPQIVKAVEAMIWLHR